MKLEVGMKVQRVKDLGGWWGMVCKDLEKDVYGTFLILEVQGDGLLLEGWPAYKRKPSANPDLYQVMSVATKEDCL